MIVLKGFCALLILSFIQSNCQAAEMKIKLNPPSLNKELADLLEKRHSCRSFSAKSLKSDDVSGILWATSGKQYDSVTGATRTAPSAGATYPLELYIVVGKNCVDELSEGVYRYIIEEHALELVTEGDKRNDLARACLGQDFIAQAPVSLVISAMFSRTTDRYGERGDRYVYMEAGGACQNTYLAVTSLGLGTVEVGAFIDNQVRQALGLDKEEVPLSVMPVGFAE